MSKLKSSTTNRGDDVKRRHADRAALVEQYHLKRKCGKSRETTQNTCAEEQPPCLDRIDLEGESAH
jgi:hypothetical protein